MPDIGQKMKNSACTNAEKEATENRGRMPARIAQAMKSGNRMLSKTQRAAYEQLTLIAFPAFSSTGQNQKIQ